MKALILLITISVLLPISAQNRVRPPVKKQPRASSLASLEENHTITLKGIFTTGDSIDLSLTGLGPTFLADQVVGKEDTILSCQYTLETANQGYHLSYTIGARIRMITSVSKDGKAKNIEFRDILVKGKIHCMPGVPVTISQSGDKLLSLTVSK